MFKARSLRWSLLSIGLSGLLGALLVFGQALSSFHALYLEHRAGVDETVAASTAFADESLAGFQAARERGMWTMSTVCAVLVLVNAVCYWFAKNGIVRPLAGCIDHARSVADGNLAAADHTPRDDEIGALQAALGDMTGRLALTLGDVRSGVEEIAAASTQIAQGNGDLSARTDFQAGNLQQTASAAECLRTQAQKLARAVMAFRTEEAVGRV